MIPCSKGYNCIKKVRRAFVGVSVVGMLIVFTLPYQATAQTCCSGGVPLGGSLGLYKFNMLHRDVQSTKVDYSLTGSRIV